MSIQSFNETLYNAVKELKIIDEKKLDLAFTTSQQENLYLSEVLLQADLIADQDLGKLSADLYNLPYLDLNLVNIPDDILHIIPESVAKKNKIVAYKIENNVVSLATSTPGQEELLAMIEKKTQLKPVLSYATPRDIEESLIHYKKQMQAAFDVLLKETTGVSDASAIPDIPVEKIVDMLIEYAYDNKASDIHIEPKEEETLIRFRIDGVMHDVLRLPKSIHEEVINRIKIASRLKTDEHLSAQDGKMKFKLDEEEIDIRISIVPVVNGENAVMRLLTSHFKSFSLVDLGMSETDLKRVEDAFTKPHGMVLSTGPTGSGKTTSMYAILKILNTRERTISTIEDPVEYEIEDINQIQVNVKTNLSFADGLRSILRQDPNIIFVGEIRDNDTADIAINSALTGHLVLSTLHTNNAATALPRFIDMDIEPFLVASTVNVIIAQRLVRKICDKCKVSYIQTAKDLSGYIPKNMITKHFGKKSEIRLYKGKGCVVCHNTGYNGRIGIFEVLEMSPALQQLITEKADAERINQQAIKDGMTSMMEDGLDKIQRGITTVEEILRTTKA